MAEHKRRARWRLFGAILIAGSVAAITPFLLEEQARPLSQDLLIEIPSKNSKFTKIESLKPQDPAAQEQASACEANACERGVTHRSKDQGLYGAGRCLFEA